MQAIMNHLIQKALRSAGWELVPYPTPDWARFRSIIRDVLGKLSITCVLDVGPMSDSMEDSCGRSATPSGLSHSNP